MDDKDIQQREKIEKEKRDLTKQLIFLIFVSFLISGAFYGITMIQNPYLKEWTHGLRFSFSHMRLAGTPGVSTTSRDTMRGRADYNNSMDEWGSK